VNHRRNDGSADRCNRNGSGEALRNAVFHGFEGERCHPETRRDHDGRPLSTLRTSQDPALDVFSGRAATIDRMRNTGWVDLARRSGATDHRDCCRVREGAPLASLTEMELLDMGDA